MFGLSFYHALSRTLQQFKPFPSLISRENIFSHADHSFALEFLYAHWVSIIACGPCSCHPYTFLGYSLFHATPTVVFVWPDRGWGTGLGERPHDVLRDMSKDDEPVEMLHRHGKRGVEMDVGR